MIIVTGASLSLFQGYNKSKRSSGSLCNAFNLTREYRFSFITNCTSFKQLLSYRMSS